MKYTVYRKRADISSLDVPHKTLWTCRNRKSQMSQILNGSRFLATRRCYLLPITLYFDPNGGIPEYYERTANVARRIKEFPHTVYDDKHLFGWYADDGSLVSADDVASVRTQHLTAHWVDPTVVELDANGGTCDVSQINLYQNVVAYNIKGIKAVSSVSGQNFVGWFTSATGGTQIKDTTVYNGSYRKLYAHYISDTWTTQFTVTVDSEHNKTGIYQANRKSSSKPVYIDWGDGFTDTYNGNVSQQVHEYAVPGTYHIRLSDNISTFALTANSALWYQVTSQNYFTVVSIDFISSGVTSIPTYAFCYLNALVSGTWASNVKTVSNYAFYHNGPNFQTIVIPEGVTTIGQYSFAECRGLCNISLPSTLTTLNTYGFQYCFYDTNSSEIVIPEGVTSIPNYCFAYCRNLESIQLPSTLKTIGQHSFRECCYYGNNGTLTIPEGVTTIDAYAFYQSRYLDVKILPSTLTTIGTYAFYQCQFSLSEISIPQACSSIGNYAFAYCTNLFDITIKRSTAPTVGAQTFGNSTTNYTGRTNYSKKTNKLHVPDGSSGYTVTPWSSPLCHASYCGFTLVQDAVMFSAIPYQYVEFNPNGGSGGGMVKCYKGMDIGKLDIQVTPPDGKTFDGWWTLRDGGMRIDNGVAYDGEWQVVYAHWV